MLSRTAQKSLCRVKSSSSNINICNVKGSSSNINMRQRYSTGPPGAGDQGPKDHSCGIPPWKVASKPSKHEVNKDLPEYLIRPPCYKGQRQAKTVGCENLGFRGYYCIPCRKKYKYPSFSENIDFVPPLNQVPPCWWKMSPSCSTDPEAESLLESMTKRWPCNYE